MLIRNFGLLLFFAVGAVLAVGLWTAASNTRDLLQDKAELTIRQLETQVRDHLEPGPEIVKSVAHAIETGRILQDNPEHLRNFLEGALAGAPQVGVLAFVGKDLRATAVVRIRGKIVFREVDLSGDELVHAAVKTIGNSTDTGWHGPMWRPQIDATVLAVRRGVYQDGKRIGAIVAMVRVRELSEYLKEATAGTDIHAFILLNRWRVLALPELIEGARGKAWRSTPALSEIKDPVLKRIWDPKYRDDSVLPARPPLKNHLINAEGHTYVVFYKNVTGYGDGQWTLGAYVRGDSFGEQLRRLLNSAIVGVVALLIAILLAILIGRRFARPVRQLSSAARKVAAFELDGVEDMPGSRVRELDEQSRAFNSMLGAMRWFQAYVPKTLVRRLVQKGSLSGIESDDRNLTVMFTDVSGFSTLAEGASAGEVASFLNQHFDLLTKCIDEQEGTVDKFIGDSVMAFWGAPEKQKNRAIRACRAALAIRRTIAEDNARRDGEGLHTVGVRIGIHSGQATVGNIGAADRVNYTAIGDMVNVAQRLEQLGKNVNGGAQEVVILISEDTRRDLDDSFDVRSIGGHQLRGREGAIEVFELLNGPTGAFDDAVEARSDAANPPPEGALSPEPRLPE